MPTYEYACPTCGDFDQDQKITEPALKSCPKCGADVKRLISRSSFSLKGGGWYSDGYGSTGKPDKRESQGSGGGCGKPACGTGACAGGGSVLN